jgi:hypothetical protein
MMVAPQHTSSSSPTLRATSIGALLGLVITVSVVLRGVARNAIFDAYSLSGVSDAELTRNIHVSGVLSSVVSALIACALLMGLVLSPLWPRMKNDRAIAAGVALGTLVGTVYVIGAIAVLVGGLSLAAMFALGITKQLSPSAGTGQRLGIVLGAITAMTVTTFVPTLVLARVTDGGGFVGEAGIAFIATLALARPILWALLRAQAAR